MSYVHITRTPGLDTTDYARVRRELGADAPSGQTAHHVGVVDGVLVVVDVWNSRADADRFAAERLFPAFERAGVSPDASTGITAFDTEENGVPA
jgi:hypothetical protein